jgi:hypothetical protein
LFGLCVAALVDDHARQPVAGSNGVRMFISQDSSLIGEHAEE